MLAGSVSLQELEQFYEREGKQQRESEVSRLGRALRLFEEGLRVPPLHAFLSMCLVLETIYTDRARGGEMTHKLATRLARTLGKHSPFPKREEFYKLAKNVYRERSEIVHGTRLIHEDKPDFRDAFTLARESLQTILRDQDLLRVFGVEGNELTVARHFRKLDIGGD